MCDDDEAQKTSRSLKAEISCSDDTLADIEGLLGGLAGSVRVSARGEKPGEDGTSIEHAAAIDRTISRSRALAEHVRNERAIGADLSRELLEQPKERAVLLIRNSRRFQRRAVCEELIESSTATRHDDVHATWCRAQLAVLVAEELQGSDAVDVQAAAWAELGNACRLMADLRGAENAFDQAGERLDQEGGDPQLEAEYLLMLGVLRVDQRRFPEAIRLNRRARELYRQLLDRDGVARCLFQTGKVYSVARDPVAGISHIWRGLRMLGSEAEPRTAFPAIHNLVLLMQQAGANDSAAKVLESAEPLYDACAGELDLARLAWLRARISTGLGLLDEAAALLEDLWQMYSDRGMLYQSALVALDLAAIYSRQSRVLGAREFARESLVSFRRLGIRREASAAIALLRNAPHSRGQGCATGR